MRLPKNDVPTGVRILNATSIKKSLGEDLFNSIFGTTTSTSAGPTSSSVPLFEKEEDTSPAAAAETVSQQYFEERVGPLEGRLDRLQAEMKKTIKNVVKSISAINYSCKSDDTVPHRQSPPPPPPAGIA